MESFPAGSSAGAGSEVFHVYRHLRRRENIRQQYIQESAVKEDLDMEFLGRVAKNRLEAEARTEKKRAKRYHITVDATHKGRQWVTVFLVLIRLKKKLTKRKRGKGGSDKEKEGAADSKKQEDPQTDSADASEGEEAHFVIGGR